MTAGASQTAPLLELRDVQAGYGPFRALFGVSLSVHEGKVLDAARVERRRQDHGGPRLLRGSSSPRPGSSSSMARTSPGKRPYRLARKGIVQAPEGRSVFASLTVEENLLLPLRRTLGRSGVRGGLARAYEMFPPLGERRRQLAGTLSGGEQRMLALARVLANPPRLLVCDELSLGLAPIIVDEVYQTLAAIREAGTTLLIVEQHVAHALGIADEVAVLVKGQVTYDGPVAEMGDLNERLLPSATSIGAPSPNGQ